MGIKEEEEVKETVTETKDEVEKEKEDNGKGMETGERGAPEETAGIEEQSMTEASAPTKKTDEQDSADKSTAWKEVLKRETEEEVKEKVDAGKGVLQNDERKEKIGESQAVHGE